MSCNWYTNDDATSRLKQSQLTTQHECNEPEQTPRIVSLPLESYNCHVHYGAALAVGISCAWTGLSEAISLLEPLTSDVVDSIRQGALIAMAMVMIQTNESSTNKKTTRLATCNKKQPACMYGIFGWFEFLEQFFSKTITLIDIPFVVLYSGKYA